MHSFDDPEYLFTHTVVREAAYAMQPLQQRAQLHGLAVRVMEQMFPKADRGTIARLIARHAAEAFRGGTLAPALHDPDVLALAEVRALRAAATNADINFDVRESSELWRSLANHASCSSAEKHEAFLKAHEALRYAGRLQEARVCLNEAKTLAPNDSALLRCVISQGNLLRLMGEFEEAETRMRAALQSATEPEQRAHATGTLARILRDIGQGEEAEGMFAESIRLHQELGDVLSEAKIAGGLAAHLSERGRNDEAERLYRRALELHRKAADTRGEAIYQGNLGILYAEGARYAEAEDCYRRALETHRSLGNRTDEAIVSGNLAILFKLQGRTQEAELNYRRTLNILREQGNRPMEARFLSNLANLLHDTGRTVQAVGMYEMALDILRSIKQPRLTGACLGNLGLARQKLGRIDEAYTALSEGIGLLVEQHARLPAGAFLALRGELLLLLGEEHSAEADMLEADALLTGEIAKAYRLQFLLPLRVRFHCHQNAPQLAKEMLASELEDFPEPAPNSELGKAVKAIRDVLAFAKAGELTNGHHRDAIPQELRRAVASRLKKKDPELAARLGAET